ncbi:MAG: hypothetical protein ABFS03_03845 [Chloroflexota bacterium]
MADMTNHDKRVYPDFYEKFIPIAIGLLAVLIFGMLVFTVVVAAGII